MNASHSRAAAPKGLRFPRRLLERIEPRSPRDAGIYLLLCVVLALFAVRGIGNSALPHGSDFTFYYDAGRAILRGEDPFGVEGFIYLPAFAVLVGPLALLPYTLASVVWQVASLTALLWSARAACRLAVGERGEAPSWALWLPLATVVRFADSNLSYGQVNAFTLALILWAVLALRRGAWGRCGVAIGLAGVIKILPLVLVPYCLLKGYRKAAATACLSFVALAALLPVPFLGPSGTARSFGGFWEVIARPYAEGGQELLDERRYVAGQSLTGVAYRLLTDSPASSNDDASRANLVSLPPAEVQGIVLALIALHVAAFLIVLLRLGVPMHSGAWAKEVGFTLCTVLLVAPLVHKAHMLWVLPASTAAFVAWPRRRPGGWARAHRAAFLLGTASIALTTPALLGAFLPPYSSAFCVFFGIEAIWLSLIADRLSDPAPECWT